MQRLFPARALSSLSSSQSPTAVAVGRGLASRQRPGSSFLSSPGPAPHRHYAPYLRSSRFDPISHLSSNSAFPASGRALPPRLSHALSQPSTRSPSALLPSSSSAGAAAASSSMLFQRRILAMPHSPPSQHPRASFRIGVGGGAGGGLMLAEEVMKVPGLGDSVTKGTVLRVFVKTGDYVPEDKPVLELETDKITIEIPMKVGGIIKSLLVKTGDNVSVGDVIARYEPGAAPAGAAAAAAQPKAAAAPSAASAAKATPPPPPPPMPAAPRPQVATATAVVPPAAPAPRSAAAPAPSQTVQTGGGEGGERRVAMNRMRQRIAERMKESQNTYAMLTTFNEVDMSAVMDVRKDLGEEFAKRHNIKLGFMGMFVRAAANALTRYPVVNAVIDGTDIVYRDYIDISVAVATPKGLVVPVLRNADRMGIADVEKSLNDLGERARNNQLSLDEMTGGTFTISNGGVFGSLMGTPIINPPQSAILGMHATKQRAVVDKNNNVVARPMMYLALTYDHRIIDGRDAVIFLKHVRDCVEDPRRLLLDL